MRAKPIYIADFTAGLPEPPFRLKKPFEVICPTCRSAKYNCWNRERLAPFPNGIFHKKRIEEANRVYHLSR